MGMDFLGGKMTFATSRYPFLDGAVVMDASERVVDRVTADYEAAVTSIKRINEEAKGVTSWIIEFMILEAKANAPAKPLCVVGQQYAIRMVENMYDKPRIASFVAAFTGRTPDQFKLELGDETRAAFGEKIVAQGADKKSVIGPLNRIVGISARAKYSAKPDVVTGAKKDGFPEYIFYPRGEKLPIQLDGSFLISGAAQTFVPSAPAQQVFAPQATAPSFAPPAMAPVAPPPMSQATLPPMPPPPPPAPVLTQVVWNAEGQFLNPLTGHRYYAGAGISNPPTHIIPKGSTGAWIAYDARIHTAPDGSGPVIAS